MPVAKLVAQKQVSIVSNYLGTPEMMYDAQGEKIWSCTLNSFGKVRNFEGEYKVDCPFRYQGQYEDSETGLYYNRFRYYSPEEGMYVSQDPIGILGGNNVYGYVHDVNGWVDILGLSKGSGTLGRNLVKAGQTHKLNPFVKSDFEAHHVIPHEVWTDPKNSKFFNDIGLGKAKDKAANGLFLPRSESVANQHGFDTWHRGSHPDINANMSDRVRAIRDDFNNGNISKNKARKQISALQAEERKRLSGKKGNRARKCH